MTEDLLGPLGDKLEPAEVTPTVVYLAHEDCPVNGEVYSVAGGVVARYFIGLTPGWYGEGHSRRGRPRPLRPDPRRDGLHRPRGPLRRAQEAARDALQLSGHPIEPSAGDRAAGRAHRGAALSTVPRPDQSFSSGDSVRSADAISSAWSTCTIFPVRRSSTSFSDAKRSFMRSTRSSTR